MNAFLVTAPVLTHRAPPRSATIEARRGCSGMAPCGPIVFSHETRLTPRRSWSRNRAQTAVVSPASSWSAYAPGHEGKSRAGSPSMTTACGGHRSYRLPLAPVRAGAPSRRPARGSLPGELECPPSIAASDGRSSHVVLPVAPFWRAADAWRSPHLRSVHGDRHRIGLS